MLNVAGDHWSKPDAECLAAWRSRLRRSGQWRSGHWRLAAATQERVDAYEGVGWYLIGQPNMGPRMTAACEARRKRWQHAERLLADNLE